MKALGEFGLGLFGKIKKLRSDYDAHAASTSVHSATVAATGSRLVLRDASGRAQFYAPANPGDAANKEYVDDAIAGVGGGSVTQVNTGAGLTGGPITTTGTVSLAGGVVSPGTHTLATVTVDTYGRVTGLASGSAVTGITASTPLIKSGTGAVTLGIDQASGSQAGYVGLQDYRSVMASGWATGNSDPVLSPATWTPVPFSATGGLVSLAYDGLFQSLYNATSSTIYVMAVASLQYLGGLQASESIQLGVGKNGSSPVSSAMARYQIISGQETADATIHSFSYFVLAQDDYLNLQLRTVGPGGGRTINVGYYQLNVFGVGVP